MEDGALEQTQYKEEVVCPGCGEPLSLGLVLSKIDSDLYVWYEGLCNRCCHKVVDPMPKVNITITDEAKQIMSN